MITFKHFLLECHDLALTRNKFYQAKSLKDLFTSIPSSSVVGYLKEIGLYSKI